MTKFENDKYYTPEEVCEKCYAFIKPLLKNTKTIIEPSAGSGNFLKVFDLPYEAYDLYPDNDSITKMDWFEFSTDRQSSELAIIGNPPYGGTNGGSILSRFIIKSLEVADIVGFILPSSWANKKITNCAIVDVLHLGNIPFSTVNSNEVKYVNVCFVVYKRTCPGIVKFERFKYSSVKGITYFNVHRSKSKRDPRLDLLDESWTGINAWGRPVGKILNHTEASSYSNVIWIKDCSKQLLEFLTTYDWLKGKTFTSATGILVKDFLSVLIENGFATIE